MNMLQSPPLSTFNMDFINVVIWAKNNNVQNTSKYKSVVFTITVDFQSLCLL